MAQEGTKTPQIAPREAQDRPKQHCLPPWEAACCYTVLIKATPLAIAFRWAGGDTRSVKS
eukprot:7240319-Pyramimonas_sp.AAC.1